MKSDGKNNYIVPHQTGIEVEDHQSVTDRPE